MLKVKCPVCGVEGFMEQRGNSYRIKHYIGYNGNQRKYLMHTADKECLDTVGINAENGNQYMGINLKDSSLDSESKRGCRLVWSRLGDLGSLDPGSNPGSPTTTNDYQLNQSYFL
jgi:hypothetical protein